MERELHRPRVGCLAVRCEETAEELVANLLVVDDDEDMIEAFQVVLEGLGHRARLAHNGKEGLARLAEEKPDVIVCDVEMPELTGPEMASEILQRDAGDEQIPIVLASGAANLDHTAAIMGAPYALAKLFTAGQLLGTLDRTLTERRSPQPRQP